LLSRERGKRRRGGKGKSEIWLTITSQPAKMSFIFKGGGEKGERGGKERKRREGTKTGEVGR